MFACRGLGPDASGFSTVNAHSTLQVAAKDSLRDYFLLAKRE
jgi:hypothetical protein